VKRSAIGLLLTSLILPACGGGGGGGGGSGGPSGGFDSNGTVLEIIPPGTATASCLATDAISLFVGGAQDTNAGGTNSAWRIEKRSLPDGTLDSAFGSSGVVLSNPSSANDSLASIALDSGFVYAGGSQYDLTGSQTLWRIEKRSAATGALDAGFGTAGVVTSDPSAGTDQLTKLVVTGGFIYAVGVDLALGGTDSEWRIEKRSVSTGALDAGFGSGGVVTSNPTSGTDVALDIAVDATFLYVVGSASGGTHLEKRLLSTGALDAGFGTAGAIDEAGASMEGITLDSTGLYFLGRDLAPSVYAEIRIEKRLLTTGALVTGFGTGGIITEDLSPGDSWAHRATVDGSNLYVFGSAPTSGSNSQWRIEKRGTADGGLIGAFGTGGVLQVNPGILDQCTDGVVAGGFLYFTGLETAPPDGIHWQVERRAK